MAAVAKEQPINYTKGGFERQGLGDLVDFFGYVDDLLWFNDVA